MIHFSLQFQAKIEKEKMSEDEGDEDQTPRLEGRERGETNSDVLSLAL